MFLVADSGSTKANWILIEHGKMKERFSTVGFNPHFHDDVFVLNALNKDDGLKKIASAVTKVFFYGAGCSSEKHNAVIRDPLKKFFTNASVLVDHDVLASALATCGDEPGISCILGTGSNSCYYDGRKIHHNNYGLGFIMGDEGSGSYLGKTLLKYYLYGILPANLKTEFEKQFVMDKDTMISHVYNQRNANVWLASFGKFFSDHREDAWVRKIVKKGFDEFFEFCVCGYPEYQKLKVHFVGSIAHFFEDILHQVAAERGVMLGKVIRHPVDSLAEYYIQKMPEEV